MARGVLSILRPLPGFKLALQDHKLVSTLPTDQIVRGDAGIHPACNGFQEFITCWVAVHIIDPLEVIKVDTVKGKFLTIRFELIDGLLALLHNR